MGGNAYSGIRYNGQGSNRMGGKLEIASEEGIAQMIDCGYSRETGARNDFEHGERVADRPI